MAFITLSDGVLCPASICEIYTWLIPAVVASATWVILAFSRNDLIRLAVVMKGNPNIADMDFISLIVILLGVIIGWTILIPC